VEAMMKRRDDLAFRQEMKFRNKLVEYLTDWVMGTSHQIAPPGSGDITVITRYDIACKQYWTITLMIPRYLPKKLHLQCHHF
jgi:neurofibromin 1